MHRLDQHQGHALVIGRQDEQVRACEVGPWVELEAWEAHPVAEAKLVAKGFKPRTQRSFTQDDEACLGEALHHPRKRANQETVVLLCLESADADDPRRSALPF